MTESNTLEAIEAKRAARKEALAREAATRKALDLEAIDALEIEHGDSNIAIVECPYSPGLPVLVAVRCPKSPEVKRYQATIKEKNADTARAAEQVAALCVVHPAEKSDQAELYEARPGLKVQLGVEALKLATGKAVAEGNA